MLANKPWTEVSESSLAHLPGALGVFELRDGAGVVCAVGYAGGKTRYGLRGALGEAVEVVGRSGLKPAAFRYEVNQMYLTRFIEVLEKYIATTGDIPAANKAGVFPIPGVIQHKLSRTSQSSGGQH